MNDAGEIGLTASQLAKIDAVEAKQRATLGGDDGGVTRSAGQQRDLAEELPGPEIDRLRRQRIWTSPEARKYIQSPRSPRRIMTVPA